MQRFTNRFIVMVTTGLH